MDSPSVPQARTRESTAPYPTIDEQRSALMALVLRHQEAERRRDALAALIREVLGT